ncbi:MAG: WXG100 family type VII secretion target [Actinobacteria bacterium]|nr:WXG100 family type VII secretion target [Actinomycetota bacterium]MBI3688446.1 WXG100 family type VII secretion target [Actinomycetota bacterium]
MTSSNAGSRRIPIYKEDIGGEDPSGYGRREIVRMLDAADPTALFDASARWGAVANLLEGLCRDLRRKAEVLADDWDGEAAAACQDTLRRIAGSAADLAGSMTAIHDALWSAADGHAQARTYLAEFRADDGRLLSDEQRGDVDRSSGSEIDEGFRRGLGLAHDGYRRAWRRVPDEIAYDLPDLAGRVAAGSVIASITTAVAEVAGHDARLADSVTASVERTAREANAAPAQTPAGADIGDLKPLPERPEWERTS